MNPYAADEWYDEDKRDYESYEYVPSAHEIAFGTSFDFMPPSCPILEEILENTLSFITAKAMEIEGQPFEVQPFMDCVYEHLRAAEKQIKKEITYPFRNALVEALTEDDDSNTVQSEDKLPFSDTVPF